VTGFILAAGFGTRLKPLTDHVPKALVPVCGIPLLKRAHDFFSANGFDRIAVNSHHHPEQVQDFITDAKLDCVIFHEAGKIRGTGGALFFARDFLADEEYFCVANVDIVATLDLRSLFGAFVNMSCGAGLVSIVSTRGTLWYDAETKDYIGARSEQSGVPGGCRGEPRGAEFMGIAFYKKEIINLLTAEDFSILPVWKRCREQGMSVKIIEAKPDYWIDLGTPATLAGIHFDVLDEKCRLAVPEHLIVDGKKKKACPRSFDMSLRERLGPYSWVDAPFMPSSCEISRSIIFSDAVVPEHAIVKNSLFTKYGAISFGS